MAEKLGKPTKVKLDCGEILRIDAAGNMSRDHFDDSKIFLGYSHWPRYYSRPAFWETVQMAQIDKESARDHDPEPRRFSSNINPIPMI